MNEAVAVLSLEKTDEPEKIFNFSAFCRFTRRTPDSAWLIVMNSNREGNNLVAHNIRTGEEKQITNFTNERIERFDISTDGKRIVMSRGNDAIDAVLIER